jgi:hypothetical protein
LMCGDVVQVPFEGTSSGVIYVWLGSKCDPHRAQIAQEMATSKLWKVRIKMMISIQIERN